MLRNNMFKKNKTNFFSNNNIEKIDISLLEEGVNSLKKFIVVKNKDKYKIYDRNCDHAGGKILSVKKIHKCPYHNWIFNPKTGKYVNGVKKKELDYKIKNNHLLINNQNFVPHIKKKNQLTKLK